MAPAASADQAAAAVPAATAELRHPAVPPEAARTAVTALAVATAVPAPAPEGLADPQERAAPPEERPACRDLMATMAEVVIRALG